VTVFDAALLTLVMGLVILFCRAFPFLFFRGTGNPRREAFLLFVEKTVPLAAMTVLAVNAVAASFKTDARGGLAALTSAVFTVLVHLCKRNPLLSIFGGTALYMILSRLMPGL
jgi:branched-subunit amino acid transport protein AzlD